MVNVGTYARVLVDGLSSAVTPSSALLTLRILLLHVSPKHLTAIATVVRPMKKAIKKCAGSVTAAVVKGVGSAILTAASSWANRPPRLAECDDGRRHRV